MQQTKEMLAKEIKQFLSRHACLIPYSDEYTNPDAYELLRFAAFIENGIKPHRPVFSEWGSGGYKPYNDTQARLWHDSLIKKCNICLSNWE